MSDIEVTSVCEAEYTTENQIDGEWSLVVDALGENGPTPNQVLAADYASCFIPALRVGASKEGHDDVGRVEVDVGAEIDDEDDLEAISFDIAVEADLGGDTDAIIDRAEDICHVHDALREELHADISVESGAF